MRRTRLPTLILGLLLAVALAACGPRDTPTPAATSATPTATASPTAALPLAILLLPADTPISVSQAYQDAIYDLARSAGYRFQVRNSLTPQQVAGEAGVEVVVAVPPDPGLAALAAAAPGAQFLSVGIPGVEAGGNISTIGGSSETEQIAPFLAGYVAAMLAQDYRTGLVAEKDAPETPAIESAFENGRGFYCGLCQAIAPPYYEYPLLIEMPPGTTGNEAVAYGDVLVNYQTGAAYIAPSVADASLINDLASRGVLLIGETTPPERARENWVATIQPDWMSAIREAWPKLVAGEGGFSQPSPLSLTDINPELLTAGKLRLAQEILDRLARGEIATSVQP